MTRTVPSLLLAALLVSGLHAAPAQAQLSRTYVSATSGNDAGNCDRPTPCRTFQVAHDKTNAEGEIVVLDPGGYGGLTITKSISIVNDGIGEAGVLVFGAPSASSSMPVRPAASTCAVAPSRASASAAEPDCGSTGAFP